MDGRKHWDGWYATRGISGVSWFQENPSLSLDLIGKAAIGASTRIIDVGGGASTLVDYLLRQGFRALTVLDISEEALAAARNRLGRDGTGIDWLVEDITKADLPESAFDVWHDRAVFHFLTDSAQRGAYVARMVRSLSAGGHAIISTFAPDGPEQCSGLPVMRYSPTNLAQELGERFHLIFDFKEIHLTPAGREQNFIYCLFKKV